MYGLVNRAIEEMVCSRDGLAPMVVGLIRGLITGLAKRFEMAVSVTHCADKGVGADHDEFLIAPAAS